MPNDSRTLSNCPACGAKLEALPVHGDCRYFICPEHRQFGITGTAIAMMANNKIYSAIIGQRIADGRSDGQELIISSDDL
ncbi:hypothetical protein [Pectobacterium carotovorum]|uniref:hypothetical protein n=1 Tax=Pectobacterium carotovorum TaxID=554 RepID=UPI00381C9103